MDNIDRYINVLGEEFYQKKLIFFIGAGISKNSGYPDWYQLVNEFKEKLCIDREISSEDYLMIPQQYYDEFGKVEYYKLLEKFFKGDYQINNIHKILEEMNPNYVITTNYDNLLEKSLNKYESYDVIKQDKDLSYSKKQKMILKIHGDLENKNIVLKKEDYDNYENNFPLISNYIKGLFTTYTVIFLGYSLRDENITHILKWLKQILDKDLRKAYLIAFKNSEKNYVNNETEKYDIVKRIYLEEIENSKEKTICSFLYKLFNYKLKKIKNLNYEYYKSLKYLPLSILKEYNYQIMNSKDFKFSNNSIFNLNIRLNKLLSFYEDLSLFNNSFINVFDHYSNKVKNKNIIPLKKRTIMNNLNLLNAILEYDKDKFYKEEKDIVDKTYISVYGYAVFSDYTKADQILNQMLSKEKNDFSKLWINYIQVLVEIKRFYEFENNENSNLKQRREELGKNFLISFTKEIELYENIYNNKILKNFNEKMIEEIIAIKNNNFYQIIGMRKIDKIRIDMRDMFNYIVFNGLIYNDTIYKEIYENYITILFEAYTKTIFDERNISNRLTEFDYFDINIMLNVNYEDLDRLLKKYDIKELCVSSDTKTKIIKLVKNYFKFSNNESKINNEIIRNILNLLWRIKFEDKEYKKILKKIDLVDIFNYEESILNYSNFLYMSGKNISKKNLINNIYDMFEIYKQIKKRYIYGGKKVELAINTLIELYKVNEYAKIDKNSKLNKILDVEYKNYDFLEFAILEIFSEKIKFKYLKEIFEYLLHNFNIDIYQNLISFEYLEEKKLQNYKHELEKILIDKIKKYNGYTSDLYFAILVLTFKNKISTESKNEIKKMLLENKLFFRNEIHNMCTNNLWKYIIFDNYSVENITLEDLYSLDEELIVRLLYLCEKKEGFINRIHELIIENKNYKNLSNAYLRYAIFKSE